MEKKFYNNYQLSDNNSIYDSEIENKLGFIPQWLLTKLNLFKDIEKYLDIKINRKYNEEKFLYNIPENIKNPIDISIYTWSKFSLNGYILRTLDDGLSMAHGLESRTPFLDYTLVDKLNNTLIEDLMYFQNIKTEKGILKNISSKYLPENIINRTKQSFLGDNIINEFYMIENIKKYLPIKKIPEDKILLFYLNTLSLFFKNFL
jgi:asparagine synthase (glutamine-hydrolysing)